MPRRALFARNRPKDELRRDGGPVKLQLFSRSTETAGRLEDQRERNEGIHISDHCLVVRRLGYLYQGKAFERCRGTYWRSTGHRQFLLGICYRRIAYG